MKIGYSPKVLQLFMNPKNVGTLDDANVTSIAGSVACGDMIKLYLKINENDVIEKITFESYGCAANIATSSMITEMVKGKHVDEARKLTLKDEVEQLGGLPKIKYHCAALAVTALRIALDKWEVISGRKKIDETLIKRMLRGLLDPHTDRDLLSSGAVDKIEIEDGKVRILLNVPQDEYFDEIVSNIREAFEKLPVELEVMSNAV